MESLQFKRRVKKTGISAAIVVLVFFLLNLIFPLNVEVEYAPVVLSKDGTPLYTWITRDEQWRIKASLDEITPELKKAIVFKEDKRFYHHPGIDILSLSRAIGSNIFHLKRTSGASTITMQVARMLDRKPRTYWRKCIEMFRALQLELYYSKEEILQLYLNLVPYGSNIQGVKAASILYFDKSPDQLSLAEITALSIIPNRPNSMVIGKDNPRIVAERNKWLERFGKENLFDKQIIADAKQEPLIAFRHETPRIAPQLAWRLRRSFPANAVISSTINADFQEKTESIAGNYVHTLQLQGVYNASVIIIDNKTHEVVTYIGSTDYNDKMHNGQVDGVKAQRSPGSTLKPLLYGLAMDKGIVTPKKIIADVPINIGGYCPENYDLDFRGNVSIEDALRQSLNIPAVKTLQELGVTNMTAAMKNSGFTTINKKKYKLGLSMILGGCEVRLDELSNYYSALSNGGVYHNLIWMKKENNPDKKIADGKRILSTSSAFMLTQILTELSRLDLPNLASNAVGSPKIAWKTGTSYGRKDAWSIGYNPNYTIGVWLGNFNGQGTPGLSGATTATPLLFQLFNAIDKNSRHEWLKAPAELSSRLVCSKSGEIPMEECTDQVSDYFISGISSNDICDHQKTVYLSTDQKFSYCTSCLPATGYKTKMYENVSPELAAFNDTRHISYIKIPPHNAACGRLFDGKAPVITSLQNGMTYLMVDKAQQLQLACNAGNDVRQVYWYVNDKYIGSSASGEKFLFTPNDPLLKISCTDDKGRSSSIRIKLNFI